MESTRPNDFHDFFHATIQIWQDLLEKLKHLDELIEQLESVCGPIVELEEEADLESIKLSDDYNDLLFDINQFNRLLLGLPSELVDYPQYLRFFINPNNYYWRRNPRTEEIEREDQLNLYENIVNDLINRAQQFVSKCQQLTQSVQTIQRAYKKRYYAPGRRGANRAHQGFKSRQFEK